MGKLQPNFSWQKYEGKEEDQKQQFQYQLQTQHIQVANSVNTDIDDSSYWDRERQTSFTWVDGRPIYTKTLTSTITIIPGFTPIALGISSINTLVRLSGTAQNAQPLNALGLPLPYSDPVTPANGIGLFIDPNNAYIYTTNAAFLNYIVNITIEYTK